LDFSIVQSKFDLLFRSVSFLSSFYLPFTLSFSSFKLFYRSNTFSLFFSDERAQQKSSKYCGKHFFHLFALSFAINFCVFFSDPNMWPHEHDSHGDRTKGRFENVVWPQYDSTHKKYLMIGKKWFFSVHNQF
jgi:hypothetical protein